jgi:hypothetical protein
MTVTANEHLIEHERFYNKKHDYTDESDAGRKPYERNGVYHRERNPEERAKCCKPNSYVVVPTETKTHGISTRNTPNYMTLSGWSLARGRDREHLLHRHHAEARGEQDGPVGDTQKQRPPAVACKGIG